MKKRPNFIVLQFFLGLVFASACVQPEAIAKEPCKNFVHYDGTNLKLSGGIHNISVGIDAEHKALQVASDLAQIFDAYQFSTCQDINRLKEGTPQYEEAVRNRSEATRQLVELMVVLSRYKTNPDDEGLLKLLESINSSVPAAKNMQPKTKGVPVSQAKLDEDLRAANPDFQRAIETLTPAPRACAWDLISEQNKKDVAGQLFKVVGILAQPLGIPADQLRTYVFMPCGDGRLHIGVETKGVEQRPEPEPLRVPLYYGFVGIAYTTGEEQIGAIPRDGNSVSFVMGKNPQSTLSQRLVRRILIEPDDMLRITAAWVIAIPIKNPNGQIIGVMSVSSDYQLDEDRLFKIYYQNKNGMDDLTQRVSSLLTISTVPTPKSK